jgi:single-stranded-DNA-specific exonuclease
VTALLGVARSALGRRWTGPDDAVWRAAAALVQATGQPEPVARVLARLGVPAHEVPGFLAPTLRQALPDPARLQDAEAAADRLLQAVRNAERIAIFADYDVDGAASSALLIDWLRGHGRTATLYVPDRIDEGYGPNPPAMRRLAADHDLIVLVDCGTLGHDAIAAADGADVLVLDHHLAGETLPAALAVVNPNRADEDGTLGHLCAASVVFLVLVAANRQARAAGLATPDLLAMLDLVALATVADVAPLIGVNRALVRQGLAVMARRERPGLTALADVARLDTAPRPGIWASCWGRASMPAGGSARPIWVPGCWPPPIRPRRRRLPNGSMRSTPNAARSRPASWPRPWTRHRRAGLTRRLSGRRGRAGIRGSSASSPRGSKRRQTGPQW